MQCHLSVTYPQQLQIALTRINAMLILTMLILLSVMIPPAMLIYFNVACVLVAFGVNGGQHSAARSRGPGWGMCVLLQRQLESNRA